MVELGLSSPPSYRGSSPIIQPLTAQRSLLWLRSPGILALAQALLYSWCSATGSEEAGRRPRLGPLRALMNPGPAGGGRSSSEAEAALRAVEGGEGGGRATSM